MKLFIIILISLPIPIHASGELSNLGAGVNTTLFECYPCVTPDGQHLYYGQWLAPVPNYQICMATNVGGVWTNAVQLDGVNSLRDESGPWVVGNHMYFMTNRWGNYRIAMATYSNGTWGTVIQVPIVPDAGKEHDFAPTVTADESTMYFASTRKPGFGDQDIFRATNMGGYWGNVENLGPLINTAVMDEAPGISDDGTVLHFTRSANTIFVTYNTAGSWSVPQLLPDVFRDGRMKVGVCYRPEQNKLFFGSSSDGGFGNLDLWQCDYYHVLVEPISLGRLKSIYKQN